MDAQTTRVHGRHTVSLPVDCSSRGCFLAGHVTNLSRGGLFIECADALPIGTEVELVLTMPEPGTCIQARGKVVWNFDVARNGSRLMTGMGIKFLDLSAEQRRQLTDAVTRASQLPVASAARPGVQTAATR